MHSNSSKIEFTLGEYASALCTEILGPHYRFIDASSNDRYGFVYCECYYGKNFEFYRQHFRSRIGRGVFYPGAVARIEKDKIILLDQTQPKEYNDYNDHYSDVEYLMAAQPDFVEKFKTIPETHDKVCKHFEVSKEWRT